MKMRFKATAKKKRHLRDKLWLKRDGQTFDIPWQNANKLMRDYPDNFERADFPRLDVPLTELGTPLTELSSTPLVSILIPQRGRPTQIKKCLELILENTSYPNYEIILIYDKDDTDSIKEIPKDKRIKLVLDPSPTRQMYVGKINYGYRISKAEYIVYLANDVEVGKNWLTEAMKSMLGVFTDGMGFVAFNHGDPQKHAYHGLISRNFVNCYLNDNIFYPEYIHFWCDLELVAITKKYSRFCFCATSKVSHNRPKDNLQAEARKKSYIQGASLLIKRSKAGFPQRIVIPIEEIGLPLHKPLKLSDITVITVQYWPDHILKKHLLSNLPEQIEYINLDNRNNKTWSCIAKALNHGINKAKNDIIICAHDDMTFKKGWFDKFIQQECRLKNWGVLGIVGMSYERKMCWGRDYDGPYKMQTLDECCIILNKKNKLKFDEKTFSDFHCYGVDICLQALHKRLGVYVLAGPAIHGRKDSRYPNPKHFMKLIPINRQRIRKKWGKIFPQITTTTGLIDSPQKYRSKKKLPKISVITPCYNYGRYLSEAVESIIKQTCQDFELIIVNDGSTDNSKTVAQSLVKKYAGHQIRLINQPNRGAAIARNVAIRQSTGKYIIDLDADDKLAPTALEEMARLLDLNPKIAIAYSWVKCFGDNSQLIKYREYSFQALKEFACFISCSSMFRKHIWEVVGGFNPNMKLGWMDFEFWFNCGKHGFHGKLIPEPLLFWRIHPNQITSTARKHLGQLISQIKSIHSELYK